MTFYKIKGITTRRMGISLNPFKKFRTLSVFIKVKGILLTQFWTVEYLWIKIFHFVLCGLNDLNEFDKMLSLLEIP